MSGIADIHDQLFAIAVDIFIRQGGAERFRIPTPEHSVTVADNDSWRVELVGMDIVDALRFGACWWQYNRHRCGTVPDSFLYNHPKTIGFNQQSAVQNEVEDRPVAGRCYFHDPLAEAIDPVLVSAQGSDD